MTSSQPYGTGPVAHATGPRPPAPERCTVTELLIDQCAHCRTPEPAARTYRSSRPGRWFPASFPSECDGCGDPIETGDQIRADGEGGWQGECCGDDDD